jgi:pimeloyl-ACP methyl ester carboxylesterase
VTTRLAYDQVDANALRTGKPSQGTLTLLHQYDLDEVAGADPEDAVRQLHQKALDCGDRDLLFALSEMSYIAAQQISRSVKPWDVRDPRDYYLGSALYAWLYLFGQGKDATPSPFDRRFRSACDFYNRSLGLALTSKRSTNGVVTLESSRRRLPKGEIDIQVSHVDHRSLSEGFDCILLADQFRVRGLSVRNREHGIGAPVICVRAERPGLDFRTSTPATVLLRGPFTLKDLEATNTVACLGLYSPFETTSVSVGTAEVPLEADLTTHLAYSLNDSRIWRLGRLDFLAPAEHIKSQLIHNQPYCPDRIPLVFVHGTFSSPLTWAEMANTLLSDPVLRQKFQIWSFIYGSGNPLAQSVADFRMALQSEMNRLDPQGTNASLRQMVIVGHSQGGLLTKGTVIHTGDEIWRVFSTNRFDELKVTDAQRSQLQQWLFLEPLPFVKRVVFIATPHRGSYLSGGLARRLAQRVVNLPSALITRSEDLFHLTAGSELGKFFHGRLPTSLDGMSPKNPGLLAMSEVPVVPSVKAHSIIPVKDSTNLQNANDGVVAYTSAHLEGVESECIVISKHSCLNKPATIREVRRILHEHLKGIE